MSKQMFTEEVFNSAVELVVDTNRVSTSFISRELKLPYILAVEIMLEMERQGVVTEPNHVGKREVLLNKALNK